MTGRLHFVVESGTDVRLVEGLAQRAPLMVLARHIPGGHVVSQEAGEALDLWTGPASRMGFAAKVYARLKRLGPQDRVLVQGYGVAALAANLASRTSHAPTFMLVCSPVERYYRCRRVAQDPEKPFRRRELTALTAVARLNARLGWQYVTLSHHLADVVHAHGTRRPVSVIPVYGVDTQRFQPLPEPRASLRRLRGLPVENGLIFFSSRIAPEKDAETLLAATRRLLDAGHDIRLLHRSGGFRQLLAAAQRVGIASRVTATDAVHPEHELPMDYQASDLCVQASREEGLGFSPLEAMACGTPVVAAAVGGLRETVIDGETGWTYPVGDAGALANQIAAALADPAEGRRRAAAGRRLVQQRYERDAVFASLMQLLRGERPPGGA